MTRRCSWLLSVCSIFRPAADVYKQLFFQQSLIRGDFLWIASFEAEKTQWAKISLKRLEHERKTIGAFLASDHQQQYGLRIFIIDIWSPKAMAASSVPSPSAALKLSTSPVKNSAWGVHRNWAKQQWQVTGMELLIPEQRRKSLKAKKGGKGKEERRQYQKKKTGWGVNGKDWQDWEYGTPIRGKVAGTGKWGVLSL